MSNDAAVRAHPIWIAPTWLEDLVSEERLDGAQRVERTAAAGVGSLPSFVLGGAGGHNNRRGGRRQ